MSQDLKLNEQPSGLFDLEIDPVTKKYKTVSGFETAITTSLFTDGRAPSFRVNEASRRRGTISDILFAEIKRTFGSYLWTFDQARLTQDILNQIRVASEEAFVWMIDLGVILGVTADVETVGSRGVNITLTFRDKDNRIQRYKRLWRLTNVA